MKNLLLLALVPGIFLLSCKKDSDTTKPVINSMTINGISGSDHTIAAGSTLNFVINVSDDIALKQLKIDIHDNFDGHAHNVAFSTQQIYSVTGTSNAFNASILVPSNASAGPYDVIVYLIDESGNEANFLEVGLEITQAGQPVVTINSPDISLPLVYNPGDTIAIDGWITDDVDLDEIHLILERESDGLEIYNEEFLQSGATDLMWNFSELVTQNKYIIIPSGAALGDYGLVIRATDIETNVTFIELEIEVN
jgi:uncharacterized membrane protein